MPNSGISHNNPISDIKPVLSFDDVVVVSLFIELTFTRDLTGINSQVLDEYPPNLENLLTTMIADSY